MIKRLAALFLTASTVTGCSASSPKTCMSLEQIRANSGCLHIFRDQVYHRGGRTLITLIRAELMLHPLFPQPIHQIRRSISLQIMLPMSVPVAPRDQPLMVI